MSVFFSSDLVEDIKGSLLYFGVIFVELRRFFHLLFFQKFVAPGGSISKYGAHI